MAGCVVKMKRSARCWVYSVVARILLFIGICKTKIK